jgi:hypothetical protein
MWPAASRQAYLPLGVAVQLRWTVHEPPVKEDDAWKVPVGHGAHARLAVEPAAQAEVANVPTPQTSQALHSASS